LPSESNDGHNYLRSDWQFSLLQLKSTHNYSKLVGLFTVFIFLSPVLAVTSQVFADELNPGLYSPDSSLFGTSFPVWTTKWWQWFIGIPNTEQPFPDTTGAKCNTNQAGPVWYLVGSAGKVERNCTIPSDKAIIFPILNTECSYSESPSLKNEEELRKCAVDSNKNAVLKASLDNREIKNIDRYRITSELFNVTYPSDPVFPTNSNFSQAVSDGWFLMLEPLKPGQHEIKFSASQIGGQTTGESTVVDVTYHLNITS
jgi:hypothetical protein